MNQMSPKAPDLSLSRCRAVALLVDGENLSHEYAGRMITATLRHLGQIAVQRVYGDTSRLNGWQSAPGFRAIHAYAGKNVTDMMLTVEAMELSFGGHVDGFALATRDRDFAPLAWSLRARGFPVLGLLPDGTGSEHLVQALGRVARLSAPALSAPLSLPEPRPPEQRSVMVPAQTVSAAAAPKPKAAPKHVPTPDPGPNPAPAAAQGPRLEPLIRALLISGPKSPQEFGAGMTQLKQPVPKPNSRWQSWLRANAPYVAITGSGSGTGSGTGTLFALKP